MAEMEEIKTLVFLDLETSGLPRDSPVKITEIALVAAARNHILDKHQGNCKENSKTEDFLPRVITKLNIPVYPNRIIHPSASAVSGLFNEDLEHQRPFDDNLPKMITLLMERLEKPICLIAHNGNRFDFPILQSELAKVSQSLPEDVFCADSLCGFREVLTSGAETDDKKVLDDIKPLHYTVLPNYLPDCDWLDNDFDSQLVRATEVAEKLSGEADSIDTQVLQAKFQQEMENMRKENERTPVRSKARQGPPMTPKGDNPVRRNILDGKQPRSYKLGNLYQTLTKRELKNAHRAEADALALLECVTAVGRPFLEWVDRNRVPFRSIKRIW